jgi:hypothetical protein
MATPARFLRAMGHALELRRRRDAEASLRRAADDACAGAIHGLLLRDDRTVFRFTPDGVVYGSLPLAEFEGWLWSRRLAARGIGRLEFGGGVDPAALAAFLDYAAGLVPDGGLSFWLAQGGIRWKAEHGDSADGTETYPLTEELSVMRQVFTAAALGERLPLGDLHAVATSLGTLVYDEQLRALPLYHGGAREEYQPAHALNTALLSVVLADALGMGADERRECGLAALLHDIGMAYLPSETVNGDRFTNRDRARVRGHPLDGARLLLRCGDSLEGAAVVCYEHHIRADGGGYPRLSYPREPHVLSRVVAVCDAFDALLAPRPDRVSFDQASALLELERSAVTQFDPRIVSAFSDVMLRSARAGGLVLTMRRE